LHAALVDKPATVERYQMGCQPQKLPPLPHFDGKDPKKYHGFERRACAMLEANKVMTDEDRKFALRMCLTDTAADRVNELVESPEFPAMSYETTKEKFFDLLSDSSSLATCIAAYRSTTQGADETCEDYLATIRTRWLDATRKKKEARPFLHQDLVQKATEGLKNNTVKRSVSRFSTMLEAPHWNVVREQILDARNEERTNQSMGLPSYLSPPLGLQSPTDEGTYASKCAGPQEVAALSTSNPWTNKTSKDVTCYNCQGKGHMANECVEPKKAQELVCWRCGTPGHRINDCKVPLHKVTGLPCLSIDEVYKQRNEATAARGGRGGRGARRGRGARGGRGGVNSMEAGGGELAALTAQVAEMMKGFQALSKSVNRNNLNSIEDFQGGQD